MIIIIIFFSQSVDDRQSGAIFFFLGRKEGGGKFNWMSITSHKFRLTTTIKNIYRKKNVAILKCATLISIGSIKKKKWRRNDFVRSLVRSLKVTRAKKK